MILILKKHHHILCVKLSLQIIFNVCELLLSSLSIIELQSLIILNFAYYFFCNAINDIIINTDLIKVHKKKQSKKEYSF